MGVVFERLKHFSRIGLDTSVFIYHYEEHPKYSIFTGEILSGVEHGHWEGITSVISLMELVVRPLQLKREDISRKYEALLIHFPHLKVVDIDRDVSRRAAQLRAAYRIRPPDALQLAASILHDAKAFVTNDRRLTRLQHEIDVVLLDDFLSQGENGLP
jgi:predicted nucleic acid-binding protein